MAKKRESKNDPDTLDPVRRLIYERSIEVGSDLKAISLALKRNESYMHAFVWKGSPYKLDGDDRKIVADLLNLPESALRDGISDLTALPSIETVHRVEYARLPVYDIKASAGRGSLVDDGEPLTWRMFEMDWVRGIAGKKLDKLAVIRVAGDSMWETLHDGDHVLVDRGRHALAQPGIFVLQLDGQLIVKRVSMDFQTRAVQIVSDNPKYPPQAVDGPERLNVVGRVIWLGRSVG